MEEHREFALGHLPNKGPVQRQQISRQWEELGAILNGVENGATRTGAKWREYWNEKKYMVRKKASQLHVNGTKGGPPAIRWALSYLEKRILAILGKTSVLEIDPVIDNKPPTLPPSIAAQVTTSRSSSMSSSRASTPDYALSPARPSPPPCSVPSPPHRASPVATDHLSPEEATPARVSASRRKTRTPHAEHVPQWVLEIEEQRMSAEERQALAAESMAATMAATQRSIESMVATMAGTQRFLENIANAMAGTQRSMESMAATMSDNQRSRESIAATMSGTQRSMESMAASLSATQRSAENMATPHSQEIMTATMASTQRSIARIEGLLKATLGAMQVYNEQGD